MTARQTPADVFDRAAATYDQVGVDFFATFGRRLTAYAHLLPGETVLEVGAGRGAATFPAAEAVGPTGRVIATDAAPEMVRHLAGDVFDRGLAHVETRVADAAEPGVPDGSVDVVLAAFVLFFLPDPDAALAAYRRALRPGGRFAASVFAGYDERWNIVPPLAAPHLPQPAEQPQDSPVARPAGLAAATEAAGFTGVRVEEVTHEVRFADPEQWWRWIWSQGQRVMLEPLPGQVVDEIHRAAVAQVAALADEHGDLRLSQRVGYVVAVSP